MHRKIYVTLHIIKPIFLYLWTKWGCWSIIVRI